MFQKAQRKNAKLRIAVTGPSGSGKTYSALRLAKGLGSKIAFIDTENGSASLYSDKFEFDVLELTAPFTTEKYIEAIKFAEKSGYDVLVIDSISHAWNSVGGLLEQKSQIDKRGGNSYTNWASITPKQELFITAMTQSSVHLISTMRSKQGYAIETNEKGKSAPKKIGLEAVQREGMEYEFTTVFDVGMTHEASVSKDRTGLFMDKIFQVTEETGRELIAWLSSAPLQVSTADEIINEMNECLDISLLDGIAAKAKHLSDRDKPSVREVYRRRKEFLELPVLEEGL